MPFDIKAPNLVKAFSKFGLIRDVNVPLNNETNQSRGFGFIEFTDKEEAQKAITEMNG